MNMETDAVDFLGSPVKTVRFGGNVEEILTKYKKVSYLSVFLFCDCLLDNARLSLI